MAAVRSIPRAATAASKIAGAAAKPCTRSMSILASRPYNVHDDDVLNAGQGSRLVKEAPLRWSLAADHLTTRGDVHRNADIKTLMEAMPRSQVNIGKDKSVQVVSGPLAQANDTAAFATDAFPGRQVMDVEEYEGRIDSLRSQCLSYAPALFVEDGAVGSSRESEVRVRVVTDSPIVALYFRSLLHSIPLYAPEAFPRTITLYAATLAGEGLAAWKGIGKPYTVVDVDPSTARASVAVAGGASLNSMRQALLTAAGHLQAVGGYRHVPGGVQNPNLMVARNDGLLHWYMRDGHVYADKSEAHPSLLTSKGSVLLSGGTSTLVVGPVCKELAGAAAAKGMLYSAHGVTWTASGLSAVFAGVSVPVGQVKGKLPFGRGTLLAQGLATLPLNTAKAVVHPSKVVIVGGEGSDSSSKYAHAGGVSPKAVDKVGALLAQVKDVVQVASEAEAMKAVGL